MRRGEYEGLVATIATDPSRAPDFGPARLGPAGAVAVGARGPLIAFNVLLDTSDLAIAQAVIYLGTAPKSNAGYTAFSAAKRAAKEHGSLTPPMHILNAPTRLMKDIGYGKGYEYDHNAEGGFSGQSYFPDEMKPRVFYDPDGAGREGPIAERLAKWRELRAKKQ